MGPARQARGYLRTAVVNGSCDVLRRTLARRRPPDPPARAAYQDTDHLVDALACLPPKRRAAVILRFYADLPEAEIAEALDVRVGTVKSNAAPQPSPAPGGGRAMIKPEDELRAQLHRRAGAAPTRDGWDGIARRVAGGSDPAGSVRRAPRSRSSSCSLRAQPPSPAGPANG